MSTEGVNEYQTVLSGGGATHWSGSFASVVASVLTTVAVYGKSAAPTIVALAKSSFDGGAASEAPGTATAQSATATTTKAMGVRFMRTPPFAGDAAPARSRSPQEIGTSPGCRVEISERATRARYEPARTPSERGPARSHGPWIEVIVS